MPIGNRDVNNLGPAECRTQAHNNKEQICYYNRNKRDTSFDSFLAVGKQTSSTSEIIFSIVILIDQANRNNNIYFDLNDKLGDFENDSVQYNWPVQWVSAGDTIRETSTDRTDRQQYRYDQQISKKPRFLSK